MKKIILLITMLFLLISCSNNNYIKKGFSQNEKQELVLFKDRIKNNLSENNLAYIKENTKDSYRNKYILEKLQNIDFAKLNIFVSEPSYTNEYPSSLLALNMNEDTYYFELFFIFDNQNKKWLIFDLKERG
ncbi:membrane lipoprotein lipid attachment site-containing protein [Fusobacterium nucleatum]|nr:membrane lipoprotein lipid attachment site-containing protein [Fusobacterium nucleatum]WMS29382.1 membrane lipoprotein lipid attachment site-containing protein [Fusobacterium nucleatum]